MMVKPNFIRKGQAHTRMKILLDILRGALIGIANVIPGVSGGTMMVSMGIYDILIDCINHLFTRFRQSVKTLWPYALGMVIAILVGSKVLKTAFDSFPLPTNTLFIGLILGSVPVLIRQLKGEKIGVAGALIFVAAAALVIVPKAIHNRMIAEGQEAGLSAALTLDLPGIAVLLLLGMIASASMVVPGISGSMMLKIFGYYNPIVVDIIGSLTDHVRAGDSAALWHSVGVLLPLGIGIVIGIFAIAKLIALLLEKWKGRTYCAILGMVLASPVVILMDPSVYAKGTAWPMIAAGVAAFALGFFISRKLGGDPEPAANPRS